MTPEEFVKEFWLLKRNYLDSLHSPEVFAASLLKKLKMTEEQEAIMPEFLDAVLNDVLYTILLGLDGEAQIGEKQLTYTVLDEQGNQICGGKASGEVEGFAHEYFHGS